MGILRDRIDAERNGQKPPPLSSYSDDQPDMETMQEWLNDSGCEATDGCWVEHDGTCEHGCESWFLRLGLI